MNKILKVLLVSMSAFLLSACITNQKVSTDQENSIGRQQERQVLSKVRTIRHGKQYRSVKRVGKRIAQASQRPNFQWRYHLVDDAAQANAFVLPGGKIFVYSGLFKYASNEAELAAVIGHEVAHALKSHGIDGAQRKQNANLGGTLLQIGLGVAGIDPELARVAQQVYTQGASLGYIKPHSRENETQADEIGLMLMAKAGYNPRAALSFWSKFGRSGQTVPEYLSTHPAPATRIANLRRLMPQAIKVYNQSRYRR